MLAAALLVVLMIAVLVAGVFMATMEETHIATTSAARERALNAAESALAGVIAGWGDRSVQQIGVAGQQLSTISDGSMPVSITVTRLDSTLYSIVAEVRSVSSQSSARRRIGAIVRAHLAPDHSITIDRVPERWWSEFL